MKNITIIITLVLFSFGWGQNMKPSERLISQLPQEVQALFNQPPISWKQSQNHPVTESSRDEADLYGEWEYVEDNATLWVTSGTDQTIPNPSQTQGQEPADGVINIDGPIPGGMNYMMNMGGMYGYDMVYIALSNNVFTEYYYWENVALPHYQLLYIFYPEYNFAGGEFVILDTVDGDFVEYFYEIEDADDQITVDEASFRINITDLTLSNDSGDSTYVLSGTLVPGTIDIEAGVSTAASSPMFEDDFGPVSGDESMTWQLHENGTGLEIVSGDDYYDSWSDTTELQWSANDDSMTMVFLYWDDYYYEEDSDTMNFAYNVENDTLGINATMDLCEMMDDDYYYGECFEMMSLFLGIEDIQEVLMDFDMTMSYSGPILSPPIISVNAESIIAILAPGETITDTFYMHNTGGSDLEWEISISNSRNVTRSLRKNIFSQTSTRFISPIRQNSLQYQTETFNTRTTPSGFSFVPVIPSTLERDVSIALIKDVNPWGNSLNEQVLQELGTEYDLVDRWTLTDLILSNYDLIIVASDQPQELYDVFDSRLSDFETFVTSGGTIQFNGADQGWGDGLWNELPGGVTHVNSPSNYNYVIDPSHPITEGITSLIYANTASHCFLQNYPDNTHLIMCDESSQYTLIEYELGDGLVLVTGITLDSQNNDIIFYQLLTNMINYAVDQSAPNWLSFQDESGVIPAGSSDNIIALFDATGLSGGDYHALIEISSNDPMSPVINIPATLEVEYLGNDDMASLPKEFALHPNYPNPFNPVTTIRFDIPVETHHNMSLQIFDITGRMVETLVNEKLEPGQHEIQWNASQHSSGVYLLQMETTLFTKTQKMILLK